MFNKEVSDTLKDFCKDNYDVIDQANHNIVGQDFTPIAGVYFDLPTLKDIRLGTLLFMSKDDPDTLAYITERLPIYNRRPDRSFMSHAYPKYTAASEDELKMEYLSGRNTDAIFDRSPDTVVLRDISKITNMFLQQNARCEYTQPLRYTINIYPLSITPMLESFRALLRTYLGKDVEVTYIRKEPSTLQESVVLRHNILFLDDMVPHTTGTGSAIHRLLETENAPLLNTNIRAHPVSSAKVYTSWIEDGMPPDNTEAYMEKMAPTELHFNFGCQFNYMFYDIPIPNNTTQE